MSNWTRRSFMAAAGAGGLAACSNKASNPETDRAKIDRQVDLAMAELLQTVPGAAELVPQAQGVLVIPKIRKAAFVASAAYGEGALLIGPAKVDYYSLSAAGLGFSFGATEYNQALIFLSQDALQTFRVADGWELAAGASAALPQRGVAAGVASTRINRPIVEVVFGQRGLIADASFVGAKYSRIIR